ncbi:MAG: histidine phosphatase family protein [Ilumatobacteraceae bacterium]
MYGRHPSATFDAISDEPPTQPDRPQEYRQRPFHRPPGSTELLLVRHGESEPMVPGRPFPLVDGHGDPALAPEGRRQAERVGERLAHLPIDAIYVTSLRRTHETAAPLASRVGIEPVVERDLREVHLGEWEGELYRQKVVERDPVAVRMLVEERWDVIPGAESSEALRARVRGALERIVAAHPDQRVVIVSHGGVIAEIMAQVTDTRRPFAFIGADNASISHVVVFGERWILRRFNDTAHLQRDLDVDLDPTPSLPES